MFSSLVENNLYCYLYFIVLYDELAIKLGRWRNDHLFWHQRHQLIKCFSFYFVPLFLQILLKINFYVIVTFFFYSLLLQPCFCNVCLTRQTMKAFWPLYFLTETGQYNLADMIRSEQTTNMLQLNCNDQLAKGACLQPDDIWARNCSASFLLYLTFLMFVQILQQFLIKLKIIWNSDFILKSIK